MNRTFADIPESYARLEEAQVVLIPVPYDDTSTWNKGADRGPEAFLGAARNMELYDIETDTEPYKQGIYLADTMEHFATPDAMVETVEQAVAGYLDQDKFVTMIGGEHSVSIGAIRAYKEKYRNLTVLQLDAHADLRSDYDGSPYNHACALHEASRTCNLIQVGIRSMDESEKQYVNPDKIYYAHAIQGNSAWIDEAVAKMTEEVYITIDLDGFDPSIMPSTGTPEPGGLGWYSALELLRKTCLSRRVVGFDIMELCPNPANKAPDFLAAKLYYKLLAYIYKDSNA